MKKEPFGMPNMKQQEVYGARRNMIPRTYLRKTSDKTTNENEYDYANNTRVMLDYH